MSQLIIYKDVEICQEEQIVLKDVNVTISSGEMVYLLGKVGSGKSSFMKTIYGELPIEGTEATALEYDLLTLRRRDIPYLRRDEEQYTRCTYASGNGGEGIQNALPTVWR